MSGTPRPSHEEAHIIRNRRFQPNILPRAFGDVMRATRPTRPDATAPALRTAPGGWSHWLGEQLGRGAYGVAFSAAMTPDNHIRVQHLANAVRHLVYSGMPAQGSRVVIKVATDADANKEWLGACVRESLVHRWLADRDRPTPRVPGCPASKTAQSAQYVPRFYFAGLVRDAGNFQPAFVVVMDRAAGMPLDAFLQQRRVPTARLYVDLERAACALWLAGVVHADLHRGNVMYDPASRKLTVLDFGMAVVLPPAYRDAIAQSLSRAIGANVASLGEIFLKTSAHGVHNMQNYLNRVMFTRQYSWFNPDYMATKAMFRRLSRGEQDSVPMLRRRAWGYRRPRGT
jgi:hypothetical protein